MQTKTSTRFQIDHFGVITDWLWKELFNQSSNNRKRKSAFNALSRLMKSTGQIGKAMKITGIAIVTDEAGQIWYEVQFEDTTP